MQKVLLFMCFIFISFIETRAQSISVTGSVLDSFNVKSIAYASVSLIRKSDSILVSHVRSNQQGQFTLNSNKSGQYIILISHSSFSDYRADLNIMEMDTIKVLGNIGMYRRTKILNEVIIQNTKSFKIKGDTLEYLADSFQVKQGAMVEDLLKLLPGMQINKKGEITAFGQKVEKVLLDGEEFFGNDPTIVTQNIQSEVVEKVQVYEKKSDQAQFTGFNDEHKQKTINLTLKSSMNHGEFGKVALAGGFKDMWQNEAMINSFKNKRQISLYGLMSNIGKTSLNTDEISVYASDGGGGSDNEGGFGSNASSDLSEADGSVGGVTPEGYSSSWVGGAHYSNKWNESKQHLNINYSFDKVNRMKRETLFRENLLPTGNYYSSDTSLSHSNRNTHRITSKFIWMLDSSITLIYFLNSRMSVNESDLTHNSNNKTNSDILINSSNQAITKWSSSSYIANNVTLNKKFRRLGRTISLNLAHVYAMNEGDGMLIGYNEYNISGVNTNEILDQKKDQKQLKNYLSSHIIYKESLSKFISLKTSYGYVSDASWSNNRTLERPNIGGNEYSINIDSLSSEFDYKTYNHALGTEVNINVKKYNLTVGALVRYSIFKQSDLLHNQNYDYTRMNMFPTLRFNYNINQFQRFNFSYTGSTRQPSITQLQPIQDNSNPLEVYEGNPLLKVGYNQNFHFNYYSYKFISSRSLFANFMYSNSYNNIVLSRNIDALGRSVNKFVNLNGGYNANFWGSISSKISKTPIESKCNIGANYVHTPNIINNTKGVTTALSLSLRPELIYSKKEMFSTKINVGTIYSNTLNTTQASHSIRYFSFTYSASLEIYFPYDIELGTNADYQYTPMVPPYNSGFKRFIWDCYMKYNLLSKKNLEIRISINDILNQNTGYERTSTNNANSERNFLTLGRICMISAIWNFRTNVNANEGNQK